MNKITSEENKELFLKTSIVMGFILLGENILAKELFEKLNFLKLKDSKNRVNPYLYNLAYELFLFFDDRDVTTIEDIKSEYRKCCIEYKNLDK
ncbi:MAG: hypothetical protein WDK96_01160 [Candidatus Paceibacterota bacterium]|jgi:hypothetical protein